MIRTQFNDPLPALCKTIGPANLLLIYQITKNTLHLSDKCINCGTSAKWPKLARFYANAY